MRTALILTWIVVAGGWLVNLAMWRTALQRHDVERARGHNVAGITLALTVVALALAVVVSR